MSADDAEEETTDGSFFFHGRFRLDTASLDIFSSSSSSTVESVWKNGRKYGINFGLPMVS